MKDNNLRKIFTPFFKVKKEVLDKEALDILSYTFGETRFLKDYEIANKALRINAVYMKFYFNESKETRKKLMDLADFVAGVKEIK